MASCSPKAIMDFVNSNLKSKGSLHLVSDSEGLKTFLKNYIKLKKLKIEINEKTFINKT
jgi:hypothetical protein